MGIEDWGEFEDQAQVAEVEPAEQVDNPLRHRISGFVPGQGFGPSAVETSDAPDSLDFEETAETPPFPDAVIESIWKR